MFNAMRIISLFGLLLISMSVKGQDLTDPGDLEGQQLRELAALNESARKSLLLFFKISTALIEDAAPPSPEGKARIRIDGTPIFAARNDSSSLFRFLRVNDEYPVLQNDGQQVSLELEDGSVGWVSIDRLLFTNNEKVVNGIQEISNGKAAQWELLKKVYAQLLNLEISQERVLKKMNPEQTEVISLNKTFQRYIHTARKYYIDHFEHVNFSNDPLAEIEKRLSAHMTVSRGFSRFADSYTDGSEIEHKGAVGDISLGLRYQIDESSSADINFNSNREILGTPFRNRALQLGYVKQLAKTKLHTRAIFNNYLDEFRDLNTYNRFQFITGIQHQLKPGSQVQLDYQLLNNSYKTGVTPNFTQHFVHIHSLHRLSAQRSLRLSLRGNLSASDRSDLNSSLLLPALTLISKKGQATNESSLRYEAFAFPDLPLRNSNRLTFQHLNLLRQAKGNKRRTTLLSFTSFPENAGLDHLRVSFHRSKSTYQTGHRISNLGITAKYFTENNAASYGDFSWTLSRTKKLYTQLSTFGRMWLPDSTFTMLAEANLKVGFALHGFRLGPVLSLRSMIHSQNFSFAADGNNIRLGAFAEGATTIADVVQLSVNAALHYGHVYSEEFTVDDSGLITPGSVESRNPVTLRLSSRASYRLLDIFDLFAGLDYYKIDRNFSDNQSFDAIQSSNRFSLKLGFTYNYN